ncbi:hypothetical protein BGX23_001143 [Mortierella sp. AD031]|nr:hypothetical protein BGX23_001143 [Mortierella sp. AD031]KAG0209415.1 hypothetical protein BGX33_005526 [Mortierella sp. NVP41]
MKFIAALVALFAVSAVNAQSPAFTSCATTPTQMTVSSFAVAPYPLCINQSVCAQVGGTLSAPIVAGAKLAITGRYLGRIVYTDNHDLCTVLATTGLTCPVPTTVTAVNACVLVKPNAPPNIGVALQILATNGDGGILFCQTATVQAINCPP